MMEHENIRQLLPAYLDHELGVADALVLEQHLANCDECQSALDDQRALSARIKSGASYFDAPAQLLGRVDASLPQGRPRQTGPGFWRCYWPHALASIAMLLALASGIGWYFARPSAQDQLTETLIASHIRSLQVDHLSDVASSDQHTVKPWFNGKLDFAPPVAGFESEGYPLVGGRLDYLDGRAVAVIVYRHNQHPINLYIWPSDGREGAPRVTAYHGYHLVTWRADGMAYWAVSDLATNELTNFAQLVRSTTLK
jgi:anti-sigma factor RsiW